MNKCLSHGKLYLIEYCMFSLRKQYHPHPGALWTGQVAFVLHESSPEPSIHIKTVPAPVLLQDTDIVIIFFLFLFSLSSSAHNKTKYSHIDTVSLLMISSCLIIIFFLYFVISVWSHNRRHHHSHFFCNNNIDCHILSLQGCRKKIHKIYGKNIVFFLILRSVSVCYMVWWYSVSWSPPPCLIVLRFCLLKTQEIVFVCVSVTHDDKSQNNQERKNSILIIATKRHVNWKGRGR